MEINIPINGNQNKSKYTCLRENPQLLSILCIFVFAESAPPSPLIVHIISPPKIRVAFSANVMNDLSFVQHASFIWQTSFAPSVTMLMAFTKVAFG